MNEKRKGKYDGKSFFSGATVRGSCELARR
jgi:hypothetical protein